MTDYLLLGGIALCLISVVAAIVQLMQTRPPRGAAIALVLGVAAIFAAAWLSPEPFQTDHIMQAWERVSSPATTTP